MDDDQQAAIARKGARFLMLIPGKVVKTTLLQNSMLLCLRLNMKPVVVDVEKGRYAEVETAHPPTLEKHLPTFPPFLWRKIAPSPSNAGKQTRSSGRPEARPTPKPGQKS